MSPDSHAPQLPLGELFKQTPCLSLEILLAYREYQVSDQQRRDIERHLVDCPLCTEALHGLELTGTEHDIRTRIAQLNASLKKSDAPRSVSRRYRYGFALAAILALVAATIVFFPHRQPPYDALFTEYFKPYPNAVPITRGEEQEIPLVSAMTEYEQGNYAQSLRILQTIQNAQTGRDTILFYSGIASLCSGDPQQAHGYLTRVAADSTSNFSEAALWFLGLADLKQHDRTSAEESFRKISLQEGAYRLQSTELLHRLQ